jgi:hypothetical protein
MLPKVLRESDVQMFKFWFNGALQDGLHYDNELFYRALMVQPEKRPRLYHLGCKLSETAGKTLITVSDENSSLWLSLRGHAGLSQGANFSMGGLSHPQLE